MNEVPEQNLALEFQNKVGGLLGFGASEYRARAVFSQSTLYPGSEIMVEVEMDNTRCKKSVDFYQLSLIRTVKTKKTNEHAQFVKETIVTGRKF
jgi:hypothetical protein